MHSLRVPGIGWRGRDPRGRSHRPRCGQAWAGRASPPPPRRGASASSDVAAGRVLRVLDGSSRGGRPVHVVREDSNWKAHTPAQCTPSRHRRGPQTTPERAPLTPRQLCSPARWRLCAGRAGPAGCSRKWGDRWRGADLGGLREGGSIRKKDPALRRRAGGTATPPCQTMKGSLRCFRSTRKRGAEAGRSGTKVQRAASSVS